MKKKLIISAIIIVALFVWWFFSTGSARADVYLEKFDYDKKCNTITLKIGVSSSVGYVRNYKLEQRESGKYITFYSTFGGINSKLGAKDTFEISLNDADTEIYFYDGNDTYFKVLEKTQSGDWENILFKKECFYK